MADKLMYIPNDEKQNYPFCRVQGTNQSRSNKTPKVDKKTNRKVNISLWDLV